MTAFLAYVEDWAFVFVEIAALHSLVKIREYLFVVFFHRGYQSKESGNVFKTFVSRNLGKSGVNFFVFVSFVLSRKPEHFA